jgi:hypothetical protein
MTRLLPSTVGLNRRDFLSGITAAVATAAGPRAARASEAAAGPLGKAEHCIFVWLGGGASQIDTWDPKAQGDPQNRKAGSAYPAIDTAIPGVQVCEHLHRCAPLLDRFALLRTVHHEVIDEHARATNQVHTGRPTAGTIVYPSIGSTVLATRGPINDRVPGYVLIGYPNVTRGPGFLGSQAGYVYLTDTRVGPAGFARQPEITDARQRRRESLLDGIRKGYRDAADMPRLVADYDLAGRQAFAMAGPQFMGIFDLKSEPDGLRESYGGEFGQRLLLSRRLIEGGVRFIEVSHNLGFVNGTGWDTHNEGQLKQHLLIEELDRVRSSGAVRRGRRPRPPCEVLLDGAGRRRPEDGAGDRRERRAGNEAGGGPGLDPRRARHDPRGPRHEPRRGALRRRPPRAGHRRRHGRRPAVRKLSRDITTSFPAAATTRLCQGR